MPITEVEWLFPDGTGGARHEGGILRLAGALPGDTVQWHAIDRRGTAIVGAVDAITVPSPDRTAAPCPWHGSCGGCDLATLTGAGRARALARSAARAFGLAADPAFVPSPRAVGHRARIKLAIAGTIVGYRREQSHDVVPIDVCGVARPEVERALDRLRAWAAVPGRTTDLESVEIRSDGERAVFAFTASGRRANREALAELGDVALDGGAIAGDPRLWLDVLGLKLRASPRSFYQVNLEVDQALVAHVRAQVARLDAERVLDLYAGIGNLSLPIAADRVPVVAVDREGQATADLRAARGALPVETVDADVGQFDVSTVAFDVAVLDPPRAGAPGVVERVVRQRPKGIVYVSCDAISGARDIKAAVAAGYRVQDVTCFDMFPSTRHFETVITLVRKSR